MKIAIIGTGISGMGAAYLLNPDHDITVFEKADRIGGHSNTVEVDYDGRQIAVDTGFIVYNTLNYPNLTALFQHLGVETEASDMSFSFSVPNSSSEWCGDNLKSIFAYRRNAANPQFLAMLSNILRFNRVSFVDLMAGRLAGLTLGEYLEQRRFGRAFQEQYLLPMGAAIWSTSLNDMLAYPAASFVRFFANHRLINAADERPRWRTVSGGSKNYVTRLTHAFKNRIRLNADIAAIYREEGGVRLVHGDGSEERFDQVVLACHSDEALQLLGDPTAAESALLGAIRYAPNKAILHRDPSLMPGRERAWASWNYISDPAASNSVRPASVTYWMNRLQNIDRDLPLFVSLNPLSEPDPALTFASFDYMHPQFDSTALAAQEHLQDLQGVKNTWFCGAYFGYGFHEDGFTSGINVAEHLGATLPWQQEDNAEFLLLPAAAK